MTTNEPISDVVLQHYGVKGMKWGVRRSQAQLDRAAGRSSEKKNKKQPRGEEILNTKLKSGGSLVVRTNPPGKISQALAKKFKSVRELNERVNDFTLSNEKGEKVGDASFTQSGPKTLELEWIGVKKAHRGQGYARAAVQGIVDYSKDNGITELNLTSSDMGKNLYESLGFEYQGEDGYYEGRYKLTLPDKVKHSGSKNTIDPEEVARYIKESIDKNLEGEENTLTQEPMSHAVLQHYGVKGMKWGVRRSQAQLDREAGRKPSKERSSSKRKRSAPSASSMDDATLRTRINRLQMEKQYNELTSSKTGAGRKFAKKALSSAGTAIAVSQLTKAGNKAVDNGLAYLGSYVKNR